MPYPPPPWSLAGHGVQTIHLADVESVRGLVPEELDIVRVLPTKTLAVVAFAHYGTGSDLEYDELIFAPAVVRGPAGLGVWVSHIYVDHPDSVAGGREIWGVPKELAEFTWEESPRRATARQGDRRLASIKVGSRWWIAKAGLSFPTYSKVGGELVRFVGRTHSWIGWTRGETLVPPESPFGDVKIGRALVGLWLSSMQLVCGKPEAVPRVRPAAQPAG